MTRKKINLAYIRNDSMRKRTFNKRKKGFFQKLNEISVLCGIEACAVVYNPYSSNPEVWPSNSGVKNVIDKFEMMPAMEQEKKMMNHESFLKQSISKIMEKNKKKMTENEEKTMKEVMFLLLRGNGETLQLTNQNHEDLCKYIDQYLKELYHHRVTLNRSQFQYGESSSANNFVAPTSMIEMGSSSFQNPDVFNSSQPTNDPWSFGHLVQTPDQANAFSNSFGPSFVGQQEYYPVGVYDQNTNLSHPNHNQYQHYHFGYPIEVQDGNYYPGQIHNQHHFGCPPLDLHVGQPQNLNLTLQQNLNQNEWLMDFIMNYPVQLSNAAEQAQLHQPTDSTVSAAPSPSNDFLQQIQTLPIISSSVRVSRVSSFVTL